MWWARQFPDIWIASRYFFRRTQVFGFLTHWFSFFGLVLGVLILCVVVSVMNGFDRELKDRLLTMVPHIFVDDQISPTDVQALIQRDGVREAHRFFRSDAMIVHNGAVNGVQIYGVDNYGLDFLENFLDGNKAIELGDGILLGKPLARRLGVRVGESVALLFSRPTLSGVVPRVQRFTLLDTFEVGAEPDYGIVFVSLDQIYKRNMLDAGQSGWRISLVDPLSVNSFLAGHGTQGEGVRPWSEEYGQLFRAVSIEKAIMFILLLLVVGIATFNIVSSQAMLINSKRADIAILLTLGASESLIVRIFVCQGLIVSVVGVFFGMTLGVIVSIYASEVVGFLELLVGVSIVENTYFSRVPSEVRSIDLLVIAFFSLSLCVMAILRPAFLAARVDPIEGLNG